MFTCIIVTHYNTCVRLAMQGGVLPVSPDRSSQNTLESGTLQDEVSIDLTSLLTLSESIIL